MTPLLLAAYGCRQELCFSRQSYEIRDSRCQKHLKILKFLVDQKADLNATVNLNQEKLRVFIALLLL
jgi:hypothetical protein